MEPAASTLDRRPTIAAVTPYGRLGPSSRVRVFDWLDRIDVRASISSYLSHRNADPRYLACHPAALMAAERRLRRLAATRPERLLLHREASPLSRGAMERRLISAACFSVYDFDDALQWDTALGGGLRRFSPKAPKALLAARLADRVVAGNQILADWASDHNDDVVVIPSCVDPGSYRAKHDFTVADPPRIGWIGSAGNESYLLAISNALLEVHRITGARVTLIGTTRPQLGVLEEIIDRVGWSEAVQREALAALDVGIAPVPDELYERGKCGYKLLQYAAAGTVAVGSPVGTNSAILSRLGFPAPTTGDEWVEAITFLLTMSTADRAALAHHARDVVVREYSFDAWLPRWCEAVRLTSNACGGLAGVSG
jgi:glycosyltransferase involved in cell wall biosynthesis